jgi:hypothetical protein
MGIQSNYQTGGPSESWLQAGGLTLSHHQLPDSAGVMMVHTETWLHQYGWQVNIHLQLEIWNAIYTARLGQRSVHSRFLLLPN